MELGKLEKVIQGLQEENLKLKEQRNSGTRSYNWLNKEYESLSDSLKKKDSYKSKSQKVEDFELEIAFAYATKLEQKSRVDEAIAKLAEVER